MPSQFGRQYRPPVLNADDAYLSQPFVDLGTAFPELLAGCPAAKQKLALAITTAVVSNPQKLERIGPAMLSPGVLSLISAETDRPGLLRVQTESEFRKAFMKRPFKFIGAVLVFLGNLGNLEIPLLWNVHSVIEQRRVGLS